MKRRNRVCLIFSIVSMCANMFLLYALRPPNFFYGYDFFIYMLGIVAFLGAAAALYFAIPFFDDEEGHAMPKTGTLFLGIGLGAINLLTAIILTPLVFIIWGISA